MHPNRSPALNLELVERKIIRVFSIVEKVELFEAIQDGLDGVRIGDLQKKRSKFAATGRPPGQEDSCFTQQLLVEFRLCHKLRLANSGSDGEWGWLGFPGLEASDWLEERGFQEPSAAVLWSPPCLVGIRGREVRSG